MKIFELDENYFGTKRVRGKRGLGATGKTPVFGVLKHEGKVFISIVPKMLTRSINAYNSRKNPSRKSPVFGVLKHKRKVFVSIVSKCSHNELLPIIQEKILKGSTIHTDGWKAYDELILDWYTHYRVFHHENELVRGKSHVNGIESFWSFAKRRLTKFNGLTDEKFILHLKECECRFNFRNEDVEKFLHKNFFKYRY